MKIYCTYVACCGFIIPLMTIITFLDIIAGILNVILPFVPIRNPSATSNLKVNYKFL